MSSLLSTSSVTLTRPLCQVSRVTSWLAPLLLLLLCLSLLLLLLNVIAVIALSLSLLLLLLLSFNIAAAAVNVIAALYFATDFV